MLDVENLKSCRFPAPSWSGLVLGFHQGVTEDGCISLLSNLTLGSHCVILSHEITVVLCQSFKVWSASSGHQTHSHKNYFFSVIIPGNLIFPDE